MNIYLFGFSLRSRRLEVVGERENRRTRGRHARVDFFSLARFFSCPLLTSPCYAGYFGLFFDNFTPDKCTRLCFQRSINSTNPKIRTDQLISLSKNLLRFCPTSGDVKFKFTTLFYLHDGFLRVCTVHGILLA